MGQELNEHIAKTADGQAAREEQHVASMKEANVDINAGPASWEMEHFRTTLAGQMTATQIKSTRFCQNHVRWGPIALARAVRAMILTAMAAVGCHGGSLLYPAIPIS